MKGYGKWCGKWVGKWWEKDTKSDKLDLRLVDLNRPKRPHFGRAPRSSGLATKPLMRMRIRSESRSDEMHTCRHTIQRHNVTNISTQITLKCSHTHLTSTNVYTHCAQKHGHLHILLKSIHSYVPKTMFTKHSSKHVY